MRRWQPASGWLLMSDRIWNLMTLEISCQNAQHGFVAMQRDTAPSCKHAQQPKPEAAEPLTPFIAV